MLMRNKFFYGGKGIGIPTAKSLTTGRTWQRMLALFALIVTLGIGQMWADATITLADVTPSSNWYEVTGVGRVTNKKGNAFSDGDYNCTGTGYKTGSSYFTVQTYMAITGLQITATSTSNRTVNGIEIGDAGASSAPSSFPSGASASGTIAKNTCDQVVTINFGTTVAANKYISIGLSGNTNIFAVTFIAASVTKHSVEYKLNGGTGTTPTQADVAESAKFTLHDGTTGITAPTGKQFAGWNDGTTTYAGGAEYTMGTSDVELTAQWETAKTNPTASFSDGAYVVGASALDLSGLWSSNSDGAVTYALKEASDDATVSGTSFTATKAGSYVVTASQAATATYNAIVKEATITVTWPATGAADVLFSIATGTGNTALATAGREAHSSSINTLSDFAAAGGLVVSGRGAGKAGLSTKLQTLSEKDADKYIYVTFNVKDGYIFTINSVTTKVVAVSTAKTIEVALSDATTNEALSYNQAKNSEAADHEFEFAGKAYEGTVTLKIYAYGATDDYRMAAPLTISGTVAVKPSPSAPSITAPDADQAAVYDLNDEIAALSITADGYPTPTYQWYYNSIASTEGATSLGASAQSASYTPANNVASDLYYYCVATNSQGSATSHYFHVTVNAPAVPTIYTETTALTLTSNKIATASETFTFSGANLGATDVTLVLESAVDGLTLSESSVTPTAGAIAETEITVSYKSLVDVAEADVNLYLKQGEDILKTIVLTYSSTAGIEDLTSISAATTWNWDGAADAECGTLGQNDMIVLANADVTWDAGFNANAIAGKLQYYYRGSKYAQGNELKFNTTIPGRVTVTFSNTGGKDIARAPRITDANGTYAPTDEADGSKNTTAKTYTHNVAAGDVLIAGFEMQTGTPANMLRYYKVEFVPTYTVAYAAGEHGSGDMADANAYVAGDEVTLLANTFTPEGGYVWSGWAVTKTASGDPIEVSEGKFTMPAEAVTVTAQWDDASKVVKIVETDVKYDSWAAAIAAIETNQTIQLIQDVTYTDTWNIAINVTLDLNGQNLTCTSTGDAVAINAGGKLTIMDGTAGIAPTINGSNEITYAAGKFTSNGWLINVYNGGEFVMNSGWLLAQEAAVYIEKAATATVNNGVLEANDNAVIMGHGSNGKGGYTINVHGGILLGHIQTAIYASMVIYHPNIGTLNIDGGKLISTNGPAVVIRGGASNITGGEIIAQGSGTGKCGDASQQLGAVGIVTDFKSAYPGVANTNVAISGTVDVAGQAGAVQAIYAAAEPTVAEEDAIAVSGGSFNTELTDEVCAPGYMPAPLDPVTGKYSVMPKDGVSLIKVATTGGTNKTVTGLYAGDGDVNLSSNTKMDNGKYIGFTLDGTTLQAGDRINVHTTTAANTVGSHIIFYDNMTDKNELYETGEIGGTGDNIFEINAAMVGAATAYVYRSNADAAHQWNGYVDYIEVTRAMNPMLTAITIDGRDGVINEAAKTVAVKIPYEADLAALTVVPTIVWNEAAATNSIVVNDGSAWIEGSNTYKLTDKDGDYTVYTITLTRDVLKHTVTFNTHGGTPVAPAEVEHNGHLAAAPASPVQEDYIFQGWAETADGAVVDVTSFAITADKEFHAVWAADGAIKLLDGSTVNHTNFITGVAAEVVTISEVDYNCVKLSGTVSSVSGVKDLTKVIAYNATTNQTKIQLSLYNTSTSSRTILVKGVVEGSTDVVDLASVVLGNKEQKVSDWIEFNNAANRTIYIFIGSSATDVRFLQVKVVESGETPMKQAGEAGYSLNFNQGRFFGIKATTALFEGLSVGIASSDYQPLNSTVVKLNSTSMSFTAANPVLLKVTTANNKTYYVDNSASGTANETAKTGESEFNLTAGTWYINAGGADVQITNIAFAAPKAEKPVIITEPATKINFDPGNLTATVVAAEPTEGTLSYQWYNADGDAEVDGATEATLTTTTEGTYYVIVTNSLAGYQDNSTKSAEATLGYRVINDATLSALSASAGSLDPTFDKDEENYRVDLPEGTVDVPTLSATASMDGYANVAITDAAAFVDYEAISTVLVTAEDGLTQKTYTVHYYVDHVIPTLVDVTGNMKWDFSKANDGSAATSEMCNDEILANVAGIVNNSDFESDNIKATANKFSSNKLQASMIMFHTTVPGAVIVKFANTGSKSDYRYLVVNGVQSEAKSKDGTMVTYAEYVPAGDVVLTVTTANEGNMFNFTSVEFKVDKEASLARTDSWLAPGERGTICIPNGAVAVGADIYELEGREPQYGKVVFQSVKHMKPGKPYMFIAKGNRIDFITTDETEASEPDNSGAMKGTFSEITLTGDELENVYYFAGTALWGCADLTATGLHVSANRAYVKLNEAEYITDPNPAPGRRRLMMNVVGPDAAPTALENIFGDDAQNAKLLIDGKLYILRGGKMFDATGRLVK